jgi:hypothetical protein
LIISDLPGSSTERSALPSDQENCPEIYHLPMDDTSTSTQVNALV